VVLGIVLMAALMLNFSRGVGFFKPKYEVDLRIKNVAGLKERSAVFYLGVAIGNVKFIRLDQASKSVIIRLELLKEYPLRKDARFSIQQIGFLGDQFVTIEPGPGEAAFLENGDEVVGAEPFNLTEVARSTTDLLKRFDQLGATVGEAITRVNQQVLDTHTLSNLSRTVSNFQRVSDSTLALIDNVGLIVTNNGPTLANSLTNMLGFTEQLQNLARTLDETIVTNRTELNASMKNLEEASTSFKKMAADMEAGKGVIGGLLRDDSLRVQISQTVNNLTVLSSNLARYGLLHKPKQTRESRETVYPGKSEFR
jgi:phospholipid/cholesterol/gamma-HCH transport system substrate-binding protein